MTSRLIRAAAIAALAVGPVLTTSAMAAPLLTDQGVIRAIDEKDNTIELLDGMVYELPVGMTVKTFDPGTRIEIVFYEAGGSRVVQQVSFAPS